MVFNCLLSAAAFGFAACAFASLGWWVWNVRDKIRFYVPKIEVVAKQMAEFGDEEDPAAYVRRIKNMSDDELMREIKIVRQYTKWSLEICEAITGLKSSVPFIDHGGK